MTATTATSSHWTPRQTELLDELQALVFSEGFRHLTVGELAQRLSCSRRTLYQLADSKDALIELVIDRWYREVGRSVRKSVAAAQDPPGQVRNYLVSACEALVGIGPAFLADVAEQAGALAIADHHRALALDGLRQLVEAGIEAGAFAPRDPAIAAHVLDAVLDRITRLVMTGDLGIGLDVAVREAVDLYLYGITS